MRDLMKAKNWNKNDEKIVYQYRYQYERGVFPFVIYINNHPHIQELRTLIGINKIGNRNHGIGTFKEIILSITFFRDESMI